FIPDQDGSSAVFPFGNGSFEIGIVKRVVLGRDSQSFIFGVKRRAFGYGPGFEHTVNLYAEVVMKGRSLMFLNDEYGSFTGAGMFPIGFGGLLEIAFLPINIKWF